MFYLRVFCPFSYSIPILFILRTSVVSVVIPAQPFSIEKTFWVSILDFHCLWSFRFFLEYIFINGIYSLEKLRFCFVLEVNGKWKLDPLKSSFLICGIFKFGASFCIQLTSVTWTVSEINAYQCQICLFTVLFQLFFYNIFYNNLWGLIYPTTVYLYKIISCSSSL